MSELSSVEFSSQSESRQSKFLESSSGGRVTFPTKNSLTPKVEKRFQPT